MVALTQIAKCSLRIVWTSLSARICVSHAHKHMHVLRTKDGARVSIILVNKVISYLQLYVLESTEWLHLVSICI